MQQNFTITYFSCQSCEAKVNCKTCNQKIEDSLLRDPDIQNAEFLIEKRTASIDSELDRLDIEDMLEDLGIFA